MSKNRFITSTKAGAGTSQDNNLTVIIPAAGIGHRMKSYGPKCLLPFNQQDTIITKTISNLQKIYPFSEIITVVGFEADKIIKVLGGTNERVYGVLCRESLDHDDFSIDRIKEHSVEVYKHVAFTLSRFHTRYSPIKLEGL